MFHTDVRFCHTDISVLRQIDLWIWRRRRKGTKGEKVGDWEEVPTSLCSSGRRQSSHCSRINASSRPRTLLTPQLLPRVTEMRANGTKCTTSKHVFHWVRGSGTGGRGGRDPLSASNPHRPPHKRGRFQRCCCKSFRRFITVSRVIISGTRWTAREWKSRFWWLIPVLLRGCSVSGQYKCNIQQQLFNAVQSSHTCVHRKSDNWAQLLSQRLVLWHSNADVTTFEQIKANCRRTRALKNWNAALLFTDGTQSTGGNNYLDKWLNPWQIHSCPRQ